MQIDPQPSVLSVEQWAYVRLLLAETIENSTWKNEHLRDGAAKLVKTICFEHMEYAAQRPPSPHSASQPDTVAVPMDYKELYLDLIMQVGKKWPDESRHDTAKRYIIKAETGIAGVGAAQEAK